MKRLVLLLGAAVMMSACSGVVDAVDEMVDESVFDMQPGLCFDDEPDAGEEVSTVPDRECDEPHDNEVFAIVTLDGEGAYPGADALFTNADESCTGPLFESYVGIPYMDSQLEVSSYIPTEAGWNDGDYEIVCFLYNLDLSKLESSMKDAKV